MTDLAKPQGILFDKDGTLFDFHATWGHWAVGLTGDLAEGDADLQRALASALGLDATTGLFAPDSPVIAGTAEDFVGALVALLPHRTKGDLLAEMNAKAAQAPQVPVTPIRAFFDDLHGFGIKVGVATNDAESSAQAHLSGHDALEALDFLAGYDSGHGAKPGPGMCTAFAESVGLDPQACWMVGDSTHDLHAGRAAGMICIAVLTGPAPRETLAPHADAVLDDINQIPVLLSRINSPLVSEQR